MALISYDPWSNLSRLHDEVNRAFQTRVSGLNNDNNSKVETSGWLPAVDIQEQTERFVITADIPGVAPEEIEITMDDGILTIQGERKDERHIEQQGFKRNERASGSFYRRFSLPDTADAERISARGEHGVLEIVIAKVEKAKARRISVAS